MPRFKAIYYNLINKYHCKPTRELSIYFRGGQFPNALSKSCSFFTVHKISSAVLLE